VTVLNVFITPVPYSTVHGISKQQGHTAQCRTCGKCGSSQHSTL